MKLPGRLASKVVIITGGSAGIGLAGAVAFAREGADVVIAGRDCDRGAMAVDTVERETGVRVVFTRADVANEDDVAALVDSTVAQYGKLDVAYSNAGFNIMGAAPDLPEATWRRVIDANLTGQFHVAKYAVPAISSSGGGSIILTASEFGLLGARSSVAYCAAKGGVVNLTRALAVDCGPLGIRVNCLTPGPIRTQALLDWFEEQDDPRAFEEAQIRPILLGRLGAPEEIASAAVFLASNDASFMTGSVLLVDGGVTAWYGI